MKDVIVSKLIINKEKNNNSEFFGFFFRNFYVSSSFQNSHRHRQLRFKFCLFLSTNIEMAIQGHAMLTNVSNMSQSGDRRKGSEGSNWGFRQEKIFSSFRFDRRPVLFPHSKKDPSET